METIRGSRGPQYSVPARISHHPAGSPIIREGNNGLGGVNTVHASTDGRASGLLPTLAASVFLAGCQSAPAREAPPDREDDLGRYDLASTGQLQPTNLSRGLHGMFTYMADAATFEECLTGRRYPVAMEGDYLALERAYTSLPDRTPGAPVMASFDGEITQRPPMEGAGTVPSVVVRRFVGLWPGQTCERAMSHASLAPQYWRIVSLEGTPVAVAANEREPRLILRGDQGGYLASAGGDDLEGEYVVAGNEIQFQGLTAPVPGPQEAREQLATLRTVLMSARSWKIQGQVLELFDASGRPIAVLEAVYFR
jgi:copper homeostasis protein (lipoprotein)